MKVCHCTLGNTQACFSCPNNPAPPITVYTPFTGLATERIEFGKQFRKKTVDMGNGSFGFEQNKKVKTLEQRVEELEKIIKSLEKLVKRKEKQTKKL